MSRFFLFAGILLFANCKAVAVKPTSNVESSDQQNYLDDATYQEVYDDVVALQNDARAKYLALQNAGLTSTKFYKEAVGISQKIAAQYPNRLNPPIGPVARSVFMDDFQKLNFDADTTAKIAAFNEDLGKLEAFFTVWDRLLVRRAHILTLAHWRSVNSIYKSLPDHIQPSYKSRLAAASTAFAAVVKEMAVDESGNMVWRKAYIGSKDPSVTRKNRVQGAENAFAPYFAQTNSFLDAVGKQSGLAAWITQTATKVMASATQFQPYVFAGVENSRAVYDFFSDARGGNQTFWDEFYQIFKKTVTARGGQIKITGLPLPVALGEKIVLPPNTLADVGEAGYKRSVTVDTVIFMGNHEHPECVTFAHTPILEAVGISQGTVVTNAATAMSENKINWTKDVTAKIGTMMAATSDIFAVQQHGLGYPGTVGEAYEQFRQAKRAGKNLMFLFPQGDNPHGHGGESTRYIPTNAEFLSKMLSRMRESGEIHRYAVVPYGISSMERILYSASHRPAGASLAATDGTPIEFRVDVGQTLLDYEVETLMNLRYRGMLRSDVPSALMRMIQYSWVEESARTYKDYPAGVVDLSVMIHDLITPSQFKRASNESQAKSTENM